MFVSGEIRLEIAFRDALARLAGLAVAGWLRTASAEAYGESGAALARVGPLGGVPGLSRLVEVRFSKLAVHDGHAVLPLRWEATGAGGALFPALDADITLVPAGERASALRLSGVYRPPLGAFGAGLDRAVFNRVAIATIRRFMGSAGDAMTQLAGTAGQEHADGRKEWSWVATPQAPSTAYPE